MIAWGHHLFRMRHLVENVSNHPRRTARATMGFDGWKTLDMMIWSDIYEYFI